MYLVNTLAQTIETGEIGHEGEVKKMVMTIMSLEYN